MKDNVIPKYDGYNVTINRREFPGINVTINRREFPGMRANAGVSHC